MRINRYIAAATGLSRRAADSAVQAGRVYANGKPVRAGYIVQATDTVSLDGKPMSAAAEKHTIAMNKPPGYVSSRAGQGNRTVYDLLPAELHVLKPIGRLDKDSDGLLLLTNDGELANRLTHPRYQKVKQYRIQLDKPLAAGDQEAIRHGVRLPDGMSRLRLRSTDKEGLIWDVRMSEGRNRQIRRTFGALGYRVIKLQRTAFGDYRLSDLEPGHWQYVKNML